MTQGRSSAIVVSQVQRRFPMTLEFALHDDYEDFATRYLGVDYEDYVNLEIGVDDLYYEIDEIDLEIPMMAY